MGTRRTWAAAIYPHGKGDSPRILFWGRPQNWSYWVSNKIGPQHGYKFVPYKGTDREPRTIIPSDSNVDEAQAAPAHNLGALTVGELGIPGLIYFWDRLAALVSDGCQLFSATYS